MAAEVAMPLVVQLVDPAAKAPHYSFSFDDFLKREFRFGIPSDRPGEYSAHAQPQRSNSRPSM
jgi:hypothetical protein